MAKEMTRIMTGLIVVAGVLAVAMAVRPDWLTGLQPQSRAARVVQLLSPADERAQTLCRRIRAKSAVVRRLLEGELTLVETAREFAYLNAHPSTVRDESWRSFPGVYSPRRAIISASSSISVA